MKLNQTLWCFSLSCLATVITIPAAAGNSPLIIHEWGTFTSFQDEYGQAIGGINTDDEPVPSFVHRAGGLFVFPNSDTPNNGPKSFPRCDLDITMRLETPVLYFHPAPDAGNLLPVTVSVAFHGGILSEFYPQAISTTPGFGNGAVGSLRSTTTGTLAWPDLAIRGNSESEKTADWSGPATTDRVWMSPRDVQAADVHATNGEAERFLFYRGVAHLDAPISVTRDADQLTLHARCNTWSSQPPISRFLWLVDIAADGNVAFRVLPGVGLPDNGMAVATTPASFAPSDYASVNRDTLRASLHQALVAEGLFDDEADALLNTWQLSYFKSPGLRLFFLVPRTWTETYLPLKVSVPADITRVMVGRIELVTPTQRELLHQIADAPAAKFQSDALALSSNMVIAFHTNLTAAQSLFEGTSSFKSLGIPVPPTYQAYLQLGRFRNALVLQEAKDHPTPALQTFIDAYGLRGFTPAQSSTNTVALFE